jgi:hypothetical protein
MTFSWNSLSCYSVFSYCLVSLHCLDLVRLYFVLAVKYWNKALSTLANLCNTDEKNNYIYGIQTLKDIHFCLNLMKDLTNTQCPL